MRLSSSSEDEPPVTALIEMQRASNPLPAPAPDFGAARKNTAGASGRLGRQTSQKADTDRRKEPCRVTCEASCFKSGSLPANL